MSKSYVVGFRKPPKKTRFRKGKSGNPKGRPKGTKNLKSDLEEELGERITLREGDRPVKLTKQRALVKSQLAKAIKGDPRATAEILKAIYRLVETDEPENTNEQLTPDEIEILETIEFRLNGNQKVEKEIRKQRQIPRRFKRTRLEIDDD